MRSLIVALNRGTTPPYLRKHFRQRGFLLPPCGASKPWLCKGRGAAGIIARSSFRCASIECDDAQKSSVSPCETGSEFSVTTGRDYLKVARQEIVRAFVTARIDYSCRCVDPFTVNIEGV